MTDRYTYEVTWSEEDGEYVGLCAEFPSLSWLSPTSEGALSGIRQLVSDSLADMRTTGEVPPRALSVSIEVANASSSRWINRVLKFESS